MPLLGFTVFKDKLLSGEKTQTIRKMRKRPIKVGDNLYLYWHPRQKGCEKLGEALCTETLQIRIKKNPDDYGRVHLGLATYEKITTGDWVMGHWKSMSAVDREEIVKRDGFDNEEQMLKFFSGHYELPEVFQVIRWKVKGDD